MIDEEITFRDKGYYSTSLSIGSKKPVYAVCEGEYCEREGGRGRWVRFSQYHIMCCSCAQKNRHILKEEDWTDKLPWIDDDITFAEKGYRSTWLKPNSRMPVWCVCANHECERDGGRGRWVMFCQCTELCNLCANSTKEKREKISEFQKTRTGENNSNWRGGTFISDYCKLFNEPLKDAVRNYFVNVCFKCGRTISENKGRKMSVHHINYQKDCGCDNTQFCVYVPLCMKCHGESNGNRWYWYSHFMRELLLRNPNYYAYHIPVVYYDEPSYNCNYVFEKRRRD